MKKKLVFSLTEKDYAALQLISKQTKRSVYAITGAVVHQFIKLKAKGKNTDEDALDIKLAHQWSEDGLKFASKKADGRQPSEIVIIRRDPYRRLPASVHLVKLKENGHEFVNDPISILDTLLSVILPVTARKKLRAYAKVMGYNANSLHYPLMQMLAQVPDADEINEEIAEAFRSMGEQVTASEAFNRTTR